MNPSRGKVSEATFSCRQVRNRKQVTNGLVLFQSQSMFFSPHLLSPVGVKNFVFQEEPQPLPAPLALLGALQTAANGTFF